MSVRDLIRLIAVSCLTAIPAAAAERSVSTSRQFLVFAADVRLRGAICDLAEQTKAKLLRLTEQRDEWKTPILVNAQLAQTNLPEAPPAALVFSQTGSGLKLQLDLAIRADVNAFEVQRNLLRALLLEMAYRDRPDLAAGTAFTEPPDWLLDGIVAFNADDQATSTRDALAVLADSKQITPLPAFLGQDPSHFDATARSLHRAQSIALLRLLVELPEGRKRFGNLIANLPAASNDNLIALTQHYPELNRPAVELQKLWSSAVTRLAASSNGQLLSIEETERALEETLQVEIVHARDKPQRLRLEEFQKFVGMAESARALRRLQQQLIVLSGHANPIYGTIFTGYERVVSELSRRKTKKVPRQLAALSIVRQQIGGRMGKIADYMNWFEATQSRRKSGAFNDYMRAADRALLPETRRRDAISIYLDALQTQLGN
ncbi:MAG: hypothetical protein ACR2MF_08005 [Chthoniobacterales bacterium]